MSIRYNGQRKVELDRHAPYLLLRLNKLLSTLKVVVHFGVEIL
jgi:hypothetical protein